ncbi:O-antigen translocase [Tamlana haliotis]|uniref:O-antigen translocase n=1 Tax=Pseudotamlana haliotis TaxID=2614804 RepID=A0A6N6MC69_9FLAO|nr:O-antigen translocase [Tamlana haliotis]KAB1068216.1 O-antigen translocase [Tamlana haliotis]
MFKGLLSKLKSNELIQVASVNSLSVFVRLVTGFISSKFTAIFIGPSGMAITGNLVNFSQSLENLSSLGFKNGMIKFVAEYKQDESRFKTIVSSGFIVALSIGFLLGIALFVFAKPLSAFVFNSDQYIYLFKISAFIMPFLTVQVFFVALLNGLKKVKDLVLINIVSYISSAGMIVYLMSINQLKGALLAIVLTPLVLFLSLFLRFNLFLKLCQSISISSVSKAFFLKILSFFSMTLFSGIMMPFIFVVIRNYVINHVGVDEAGYWEGMRKISNYFMLFVYTLFQMYLLPSLSEKNALLKNVVSHFYKMVLPIVLICFLVIYLLKVFIIKLVLTDAFLPMQELFLWQLIGDFFRIMFLTISYQFLAKRMVGLYMVCEAIYMLLIYFLSIYFIDNFGLVGVVKAHALSCFIYLFVLLFVFRKTLFTPQVSTIHEADEKE